MKVWVIWNPDKNWNHKIYNELGLCGHAFSLSFWCWLEAEVKAFEALLILNYHQLYFELFFFVNFTLKLKLENCLLSEHNHPLSLRQFCFWLCSWNLFLYRIFFFFVSILPISTALSWCLCWSWFPIPPFCLVICLNSNNMLFLTCL